MASGAKTPQAPYGTKVDYADPGYQTDGQKRYPLDTERHVRSAWAYINMPKNEKFYTAQQLKSIKDKIKAAAKRYGIEIDSQFDDGQIPTMGDDVEPVDVNGYAAAPGGAPSARRGAPYGDGSGDGYAEEAADPADRALAEAPYGQVAYADPGFQSDGKKRYPIDTVEHIRAALAYIGQGRNAAKYSAEQLKTIKGRIAAAAKKHGIDVGDDAQSMSEGRVDIANALVAAAAPVAPPASWFADPHLACPTRMTVTPEGRVFGHLAQWRVCHVGVGNACVMAPHSRANYDLFKVGQLILDNGSQIPVGKITLGTGHANAQYGVMPSREHYDNTGWTAAVVNVGEDKYGIWVSGALASGMSPERVVELRAAALSGDWRRVNGNLELIAALAVNSPGFPIYQENNGRAFSLVSVGMVTDDANEFSEWLADDMTEDGLLLASAAGNDGLSPEQRERRQRLDAIVSELEESDQERRAAQLAALDADEEDAPAPKGKGPDALAQSLYYQHGGGQFRVVGNKKSGRSNSSEEKNDAEAEDGHGEGQNPNEDAGPSGDVEDQPAYETVDDYEDDEENPGE